MKSNAERERWIDTAEDLKHRLMRSRILILAAHPDDEAIGASTILTNSATARVVFLTDGAPHDRKLWSSGVQCTRKEYAELRRKEAYKSLSIPGVGSSRITFMDAVDQEAIQEARALVTKFAKILGAYSPEIVVTHAFEGGHPDHDTASLVAALAVRHHPWTIQIVEMTSYHGRDGQFVSGEFLPGTGWGSEFVWELSAEIRERKIRMMDSYKSQERVLEGFSTERERFREAPRYDFTRPPHAGKLWYECMGWPMSSHHWATLAAQVLAETGTACG